MKTVVWRQVLWSAVVTVMGWAVPGGAEAQPLPSGDLGATVVTAKVGTTGWRGDEASTRTVTWGGGLVVGMGRGLAVYGEVSGGDYDAACALSAPACPESYVAMGAGVQTVRLLDAAISPVLGVGGGIRKLDSWDPYASLRVGLSGGRSFFPLFVLAEIQVEGKGSDRTILSAGVALPLG